MDYTGLELRALTFAGIAAPQLIDPASLLNPSIGPVREDRRRMAICRTPALRRLAGGACTV